MFSQDYTINRQNFRDAAKHAGAALSTYGRGGHDGQTEEATTDVAIIGNKNAQHIVILSSGLHGVELPAGSMLQQMALQSLADNPYKLQNILFIFVHALNPYGAIHALRTDHDETGANNIDPARNFINFAAQKTPLPSANPLIAEAFAKADLSVASEAMMWARLLYTASIALGYDTFKRQFVQGQYSDPFLPYYGGQRPCHTRLTWEKIVQTHIAPHNPQKLWHFDIHTGDGPYGALQLYINNKDDEDIARCAQQLVDLHFVRSTADYFADLKGDIVDSWKNAAIHPACAIVPITVEIGTSRARLAGVDTLGAILNRTLLQQKYGDRHKKAAQIIQAMRDAFTPRDMLWEKRVRDQSEAFLGQLFHILP